MDLNRHTERKTKDKSYQVNNSLKVVFCLLMYQIAPPSCDILDSTSSLWDKNRYVDHNEKTYKISHNKTLPFHQSGDLTQIF